ncbi:hypothetical protein [Streptomyces misionensis]|uniref:hypothetical protein n=1 Tax=Streptomyces misionensis TaxID=67331 RepID=UPI0033A97165
MTDALSDTAGTFSADITGRCTGHGFGFVPRAPLSAGRLTRPGGPVDRIATAHGARPSQVAPAWPLARSEVVLPLPDTSKVAHPEEDLPRRRCA